MTFARTWAGRAYRAASVAPVAPLAILLAGALIAMGGGVGGLGSLGQLSSGPDLPRTGVPELPRPSPLADSGALAVGRGSAITAPSAAARSASGTAPQRGTEARVPRSARTPAAVQPAPPSAAPLSAGSPPPSGGRPGPAPAPPPAGPTAGGDPVAGLVETTRGVTTPLTRPVSPVAEPILDGLLGPRGH